MTTILAITVNTFREAMRNRVLINVFIFAVGLILLSVIVGTLSIGAGPRITLDIGLASITLAGSLLAIYLGVGSFAKELERRTVYTVLARPLSRSSFVLGKYLGLVLVLLVNIAAMGVAVVLTLLIQGVMPSLAFLAALWLAFLETCVVGAVATAFATYSSATLAGIFTLSVFLAGSLVADLQAHADQIRDALLRAVLAGLFIVLPDLSTFSLRIQVANDFPVPPGFVASATGYGLCYLAVVLAIACLIFHRRELT